MSAPARDESAPGAGGAAPAAGSDGDGSPEVSFPTFPHPSARLDLTNQRRRSNRALGGYAVEGDSDDSENELYADENEYCEECVGRLMRGRFVGCVRGPGDACEACHSSRTSCR
ncbi:uncharacterized protein C8A04DRAFT_15854 [Dichotomopilus funicola]|uniref:Uncharacterized protein n=1 Tax=Dichotomopilus funicola TaxID=1934379 RepID=A0AAN6ZIU4_9PEZI|nr:hypothetical protein C8A04DRAFT_15854 [Dichotomopilus funicola]